MFKGSTEGFLCRRSISFFNIIPDEDDPIFKKSGITVSEEEHEKPSVLPENAQILTSIKPERLRMKYPHFYSLFPEITKLKSEGDKIVDDAINEALGYHINDTTLENLIISNAIYRRYILYQFDKYNTVLKKTEWSQRYLQATAIYEKETHENRKILSSYHVFKCFPQTHIDTNCMHAHGDEELRRRPLFLKGKWNYYPIPCQTSSCNDKTCPFSHNFMEINYHPLLYKTILCPDITTCQDPHCYWAHGNEDVRSLFSLYNFPTTSHKPSILMLPFDIKDYKTQPCGIDNCSNPFCEYYHHSLERRREVGKYQYVPAVCPNVFKGDKFLDPANCPKRDMCKYSHTLTEYLYHPEKYKVSTCTNEKCSKGKLCPDKHENKTVLNQDNMKEVFEEMVEKLEKEKEKLDAYKSVAKDWVCSRCYSVISRPGECGTFDELIICRDCIDKIY